VDDLFGRADPRVAEQTRTAVDELRSLGASVDRAEVPLIDESGTIGQLLMLPEAAEVHLPWLRTKLGDYGADVRARLLAGLLMPGTAHVTGLRARRGFLDELGKVFERFDLLVPPEMPVVPPPIDDLTVELGG